MRLHKILVAAALVAASLFSAAEATPITYALISPVFSGLVGAKVVTNGTFTWTITANTADATVIGPGTIAVPAITSTINVPGIGTLNTTNPFAFGAEPGANFYAFFEPGGNEVLEFGGNPSMAGYNGVSTLATMAVFYSQPNPIATDHGDFLITSTPVPVLFFQATTGNIPEPATLALVGAGLAGAGALRRRKQKA